MPNPLPRFTIGIPIYEGVDLLDVTAPCEVFNWMKSSVAEELCVKVLLLTERDMVVASQCGVRLTADLTFDDAPQLDLLWTPGGRPDTLNKQINNPVYLDFLRKQSAQATYVTSVCEGALLLAAAGLLDDHEVTTHWAFIPCLAKYPKVRVAEGFPRFVVSPIKGTEPKQRYVVTGGGISSGLDESFKLVEMIAGTAVAISAQQTMQYYPDPPVSSTLTPATTCPLDDAQPPPPACC